jgi:PAS domain S-box-containing protein
MRYLLSASRSRPLTIVLGALAAVALFVNARLAVLNVRRMTDAQGWVKHTYDVLDALAGLQTNLVDAEAAQRGYLLTGQLKYLGPYQEGRAAAERNLTRIALLARDNPAQKQRLTEMQPLVAARFDELGRTINIYDHEGGMTAARRVVAEDRGKRLMESLRTRIAQMTAFEKELLADRVHAMAEASQTTLLTSLIGLGASFILLAGAMVVARRSVRERERAAERLFEEKERLRITLTSIGDAVVVTDRDGVVTMVNQIAGSILGWGDDAVGKKLDEVFQVVNEDTREKMESPVRRVLQEKRPVGLANHTLLIRRDGSEVPVDDSAAPILAVDGSVVGVVLVFRSIEQRRKSERELQRRGKLLEEQDQRKDAFLASLSHEMRNPLAALRNAVEVLDRSHLVDERADRARGVVDRQVVHLTRLVDDLLDVSRIARGKIRLRKERIDLAEVVRKTVDDHQEIFARARVNVELRPAPTPLWINADPTRMAQVTGNLLENAAKFTSAGGRVTISVERENGRIVLRVRDTGAGIDPAMLPNIFQPFFQAEGTLHQSTTGLGLGLALSKALVELHSGTVEAASSGPGKGAEFVVAIPSAEGAAASAAVVEKPASPRARKVLIIEDNEDAALTLSDVLELEGHRAQVASDGESGVEAARSFKPDVVFCDVGLPGIDGYEVAKRLRAEGSSAVLVALTGYAAADDVKRVHDAGFDHHLPKPADMDRLMDILASA